MISGQDLQAAVTLLVPVVTGVVTATGIGLKDARLAHDQRSVRDRALADASAQVAFASDWWKARQLLGDEDAAEASQKFAAWLDDAEQLVASTKHLAAGNKNRVSLQRMLLIYPMHRRSAQVARILFLLAVTLLIIVAASTASDSLSRSQRSWVGSDLVTTVFFAVIVVLLRIWAVNAEHRQVPVRPVYHYPPRDRPAVAPLPATSAPVSSG